MNDYITKTTEKFAELLKKQLERAEKLNQNEDFTDFTALDKIVIGIIPGDGIGPIILREAENILNFLLKDEIRSGKVELKKIEGLTIENRVKQLKSIPDDVMAEIKKCNVLLKGPTTTPSKGDGLPNLESANVTMRRELDLFANVRPVKVPEKGIDWTFFRENTEGSYAVGSQGINVNDDLAVDFCIHTTGGCERIARAAFEFAKNNGKKRVSTRRMYSGYIFVKMIMNDETWHLVKNTARITGFLGGSANKPSPLPAKDIEAIKSKMEAGSEAPRPRVEFEVGGSVRIKNGPFTDFNGIIEEVNYDKNRLRVMVSIFGRDTPVELAFNEVEKA